MREYPPSQCYNWLFHPRETRRAIDAERLRRILAEIRSGDRGIEEALDSLKTLPYQDLGFAKIDHHRALRKGAPEVVMGEGKTPEQLALIAQELAARADTFLITRAEPGAFEAVKAAIADAAYHPGARAIVLDRRREPPAARGIAIVTAGTADLPVAEEAAVTCRLMGNEPELIYDVGVAGLHRLLDNLPALLKARVIVTVAGMEGTLPGVVGGLVSAPVIAVPTSVGYGVGLKGLSALATMLNACAPGVAVVNIDNGFGAGYLASIINGMAVNSTATQRGTPDGAPPTQG